MADEIVFDATLQVFRVPPLELLHTVSTETSFDLVLSDGRVISYPRELLQVGELITSFQALEWGWYRYEYTFDNRQVKMVRVGEFHTSFPDAVLEGPSGWSGMQVAWFGSGDPAERAQNARYAVTSRFLPGPMPLHIAGPDLDTGFQLPFSVENPPDPYLAQSLWSTISFYGNSIDPLVIGPAFRPAPEEREVRAEIHRFVSEYGLEFLRPLDDPSVKLLDAATGVLPTTEFETKVLEALKEVLWAMVGDPTAEDMEARVNACRAELVRRCAKNLRGIQRMKIHLTEEESEVVLSREGWSFEKLESRSFALESSRDYRCQAGKHELRATVQTDYTDQRVTQVTLRTALGSTLMLRR